MSTTTTTTTTITTARLKATARGLAVGSAAADTYAEHVTVTNFVAAVALSERKSVPAGKVVSDVTIGLTASKVTGFRRTLSVVRAMPSEVKAQALAIGQRLSEVQVATHGGTDYYAHTAVRDVLKHVPTEVQREADAFSESLGSWQYLAVTGGWKSNEIERAALAGATTDEGDGTLEPVMAALIGEVSTAQGKTDPTGPKPSKRASGRKGPSAAARIAAALTTLESLVDEIDDDAATRLLGIADVLGD